MIMADTKKKRRRAYLESFRKNEEGTYEYAGNVYEFQGTGSRENELRRELVKFWGAGLVLMGSLAAAGCISAPGMGNCFYVLLPYAAALMSGVSTLWALCRLTSGSNPLKEYVYEASVVKMPGRTVLTIFCIAMSMMGELVYICFHGIGEMTAGFCIFMVLNLLAAVCAMMMRRQILGMRWKKYGNI